MREYVSREATLKAIYTSTAPALEVRAMPAADVVEVRHGWWIAEPNCWYRCSECGNHYPSIKGYMEYLYCPKCGVKMDGGQKDV